ncbi:MAG: bacterioferritin-associated ferredoxin [Tabrizicola flagellatus]|uniref:(2Fe-2S)-binding protein n=1 Tax=Tabrizicola flagellatus TaxID=2593021 RepID=UPI003919C8BA
MIVCQCLAISDADIRAAIAWMRAADPETIVTAGKIYRVLGKQADCGGCMSLFVETMRQSPGFPVVPCSAAPPILRQPPVGEAISE